MKYFLFCLVITITSLCPAAKVRAAKVKLQSVTVSPASSSVTVSGSQQFSAIARYSNGSMTDVTSAATWTSSNVAVATVSGGLALGVSAGPATISASYSSANGSATLTVNAISCSLHSVSLSWIDSDPVTFKVYRSSTSSGPYSPIAGGLTLTAYNDGNTPAGNYYYVVAAVDSLGVESVYSPEVSAIVPCQ